MTKQDMIRGHRKKSVMLTDTELLEVRGKYFEDGRFTHHHKRLISPTVITKWKGMVTDSLFFHASQPGREHLKEHIGEHRLWPFQQDSLSLKYSPKSFIRLASPSLCLASSCWGLLLCDDERQAMYLTSVFHFKQAATGSCWPLQSPWPHISFFLFCYSSCKRRYLYILHTFVQFY